MGIPINSSKPTWTSIYPGFLAHDNCPIMVDLGYLIPTVLVSEWNKSKDSVWVWELP